MYCLWASLWQQKRTFCLIQINKRNLLVGMLVLAFIGTILINLSTKIDDYTTYVALSVLGLGMSGLLTSSLYLVNEYATA